MAWRGVETASQRAVKQIQQAIRAGTARANLVVAARLDLSGITSIKTLPPGLSAGWLDLSGCTTLERLPADLNVRRLTLNGEWDPSRLLPGLRCYQLDVRETTIEEFPQGVWVEHRLDLQGSRRLRSLPSGLKVGCLNLRDCVSLQHLPEGLECYFLDISGCTALEGWPKEANVSVGRFAARGCLQLRNIPPWLTSIAQLDLRDCTNIRELPENLHISSWIDVAGTRIRSLPDNLKGVQLRWRGVAVDERIAFFPELITAEEILSERNAEKRRVLLERMGYEAFLAHAKARTIHEDRDAGGVRRLVCVPMKQDEDLVCVSVICPSTGRQYVIRVPPTMQTCHQAVAWVAGFDNPDEYRPLIET